VVRYSITLTVNPNLSRMAASQNRQRAKHWCFTVNNPCDDDNKILLDDVEYIVVGNEEGENKTKHWQGYVCFKTQKYFSTVKKMIPRAHLEVMRAKDPLQAADYCKKDGDYNEYGNIPQAQSVKGGNARMESWNTAKDQAINGNIEDIEASIYIPYYNTLKRIKADHASKISPIPTLDHEWHYGPTGTGKSRKIRTENPNAFIKDANRWWDGYIGEDTVIIEDVDKYDLKLGRYLKLWGDHYAFPADFKHQGKLDIRPKKMIITSNYAPREIWTDEKTYGPIERRYRVIEYGEVPDPSCDVIINKYRLPYEEN